MYHHDPPSNTAQKTLGIQKLFLFVGRTGTVERMLVLDFLIIRIFQLRLVTSLLLVDAYVVSVRALTVRDFNRGEGRTYFL